MGGNLKPKIINCPAKMISIRLAEVKDCKLLWKWRNELTTRQASFDSQFIHFIEHRNWFELALHDPNIQILILQNSQKQNIGQVRFNISNSRVAEIDISIDKNERNKGYGYNGLVSACNYAFDNFGTEKIQAHIKMNNEISKQIFIKARFINHGVSQFRGHQSLKMTLLRSSKNLKQRYIIATVKSWNIRLFEQQITKSPGTWKLISEPTRLHFETLNEFNPRYIFFIHWSNRVPKKIVDNFECICFHMTNLPYGRGGSPLQNLIIRGYKDTMISAIRMVEKIDAGPIYCQRPLSLLGNAEEIFIRAGKIIAEMIYELIEREQQPIPQYGKIVKFKRRSSSESHIPIDTDLQKVFDWIRMLDAEGYPPAFIKVGNLKVEFKRAALRYNRIEANTRITLEKEMIKND